MEKINTINIQRIQTETVNLKQLKINVQKYR